MNKIPTDRGQRSTHPPNEIVLVIISFPILLIAYEIHGNLGTIVAALALLAVFTIVFYWQRDAKEDDG